MIITLWSHEGDLAQMRIQYNRTFLSANLIIQATKFVLEHNTTPKCFWNVRFVQTRMLLPKDFYENFSNKVLLTRRVLSIYGVKDEGNFYNNLEFDGAQVEEKNTKEFVSECAKANLLFLDESCLEFPKIKNTDDKSNEVPEEIPLTSYFGNAIDYKEIVPSNSTPNVSASNAKIIRSPSPPRPLTPLGDIDDPFRDHPIPSNACAQKITSLIDIHVQPPFHGNLYISIYFNDLFKMLFYLQSTDNRGNVWRSKTKSSARRIAWTSRNLREHALHLNHSGTLNEYTHSTNDLTL